MKFTRTFFNALLIAGLSATAIGMYVLANADDYATRFVNHKLDELFVESGLDASIGRANIVSGVGLELRQIEINDLYSPGNAKLFSARSVLVRFPADIEDWLAGKIQPTAIEFDGLKCALAQEALTPEFFNRLKTVLNHLPKREQIAPVRISDSQIVYRCTRGIRKTIVLNDLHAEVDPDDSTSARRINIKLRGESELAKNLQIKATVDLDTKSWGAEILRMEIPLDGDLVSSIDLPVQFDKSMAAGMSGTVAIRARAVSAGPDSEPRFAVRGKAVNVAISNGALPGIVRDTSADFQIDNHQIKVNKLSGVYDKGTFDLNYEQTGLFERDAWKISGSVSQFNFDERLDNLLTGTCKKFCRDFSPHGTFDMQFALDSNGRKNITSQITDMSFSFHRFPYRVNGCVGNVSWINDLLDFRMQAIDNGQLLQFSGRVKRPGKLATYRMDFGTDGRLPINEKMLGALQNYPAVDRAFRDLRATGFASGHGYVEKIVAGSTIVKRDIQIRLHDGRVRHRKFDYPMQDVSGSVQVTNDGFSFDDIRGHSSTGTAICNGSWDARNGLQLVFNCDSTQLDDHLRGALTPGLQEIWDSFRPRGKLETGRVLLDLPIGGDYADIRLLATMGDPQFSRQQRGISVYPTWFPYRIDDLSGTIEIGGGVVVAKHIVGKHGKTRVGFNGEGKYSDSDWSFTMRDLLATQVKPEDELLYALPTELSDAIRESEFDGMVNASGTMYFSGNNVSENFVDSEAADSVQLVAYKQVQPAFNMGWDVRLDMDQSKMLVGLPLENIFGSLRLKGTCRNDICQCAGTVNVDSLTVQGVQVTNLQGPIWIDNNQTLAGKFARASESDAGESIQGELFGGKVSFDGMVSHSDKYPFRFQTIVEQSQLQELAAEIYPEMQGLLGEGYGLLQLTGNANEAHTYSGQGNLHLSNAKIQQLPIVLSLLKILNVKEVNRTAFDSSNVDFFVEGNQINLERIELIGDAISLIGNGYLELTRHADINFYSVVGRNRFYIPLISDLYRAGSQRIMWIKIGGPLDNLQITREVLPGLNDSLRTLISAGDNGSADNLEKGLRR